MYIHIYIRIHIYQYIHIYIHIYIFITGDKAPTHDMSWVDSVLPSATDDDDDEADASFMRGPLAQQMGKVGILKSQFHSDILESIWQQADVLRKISSPCPNSRGRRLIGRKDMAVWSKN